MVSMCALFGGQYLLKERNRGMVIKSIKVFFSFKRGRHKEKCQNKNIHWPISVLVERSLPISLTNLMCNVYYCLNKYHTIITLLIYVLGFAMRTIMNLYNGVITLR